jgi:hypothetical protein
LIVILQSVKTVKSQVTNLVEDKKAKNEQNIHLVDLPPQDVKTKVKVNRGVKRNKQMKKLLLLLLVFLAGCVTEKTT